MTWEPTNPLLRYIHQIGRAGTTPAETDEGLLERFVTGRDEAAFAALLDRHGPMVLGVCRRVLHQAHDVDDAFQTTFLVLVEKAGVLRERKLLGNWLYGVAYRTAAKMRRKADKQLPAVGEVASPGTEDVEREVVGREVRAVVDEEIERLPERYRQVVVLCYLQGKTNAEAARLLGCPQGTVFSRLACARQRLHQRLTRRGVTLSATALIGWLAAQIQSAVLPAALAQATVSACRPLTPGVTLLTTGGSAPPPLGLRDGVKTFFKTNRRRIMAVLLVVGIVSGMILLPRPAQLPEQTADQPAQGTAAPARPNPKPLQPPWQLVRQQIPEKAIKHWAVEELPLPRDRLQFGIGEAVDLWIDHKAWKKPNGVIVWRIRGAGTVFPVVGEKSRMKVDLRGMDSQLAMEAFQQLVTVPGGDPQPVDRELSAWLKKQLRDMKKRSGKLRIKVPPDELNLRPELRQVLQKLDGYRTGSSTSLIAMDQLAPKLRQEFKNPGERGQIAYTLAHVHGQSGLLFPEKVMEYARQALELPLPPEQRFQLYVYWGDAHRVDKRSLPPAVKRRWSALRYLEGLKQLLPYHLPDKAPELPVINKLGAHMPGGDPASEEYVRQLQEYLKEKAAHDKAWADRRKAEFIGRLVWERAVLKGQIVDQYHKDPAAWSELRAMANAILVDRQAVDQLLADVKSGKNAFSK